MENATGAPSPHLPGGREEHVPASEKGETKGDLDHKAEGDSPAFWSNPSIGGEAVPGNSRNLAAKEGHADDMR